MSAAWQTLKELAARGLWLLLHGVAFVLPWLLLAWLLEACDRMTGIGR
jgi:hypothetical protein